MSRSKPYALDANAFIESHQRYYSFATCPGFWAALLRHHDTKRVLSIDRIRTELVDFDDELSDWVRQSAPATFFKGTADKAVVDGFGKLMAWVQNQTQFTREAKAEFAEEPDGWLIAYALCNNCIVVTHEQYAPDAQKRVMIPNVCIEFGVAYCNTFEMLHELGVKLILQTKRRPKK